MLLARDFSSLLPHYRPHAAYKTTKNHKTQTLTNRRFTTSKGVDESPDVIYDDDVPLKGFFNPRNPDGFVQRSLTAIRNHEYDVLTNSIQKKIDKLEPRVRELMKRDDFENFSRFERDDVANWASLQQELHTYRRRKFMGDSAQKAQASMVEYPTKWEKRFEKLQKAANSAFESRYPVGSDPAHLYTQEVIYRQAVEYGREVERIRLRNNDLNAFNVRNQNERILHFEPSLPPSYKARAANALKNEQEAYDKEDRKLLDGLVERSAQEIPLEVSVLQSASSAFSSLSRRHNQITRRINSIRIRRAYSTSNNSQEEAKSQKQGILEKIKAWAIKNGPLGTTLYLAYSAIDLTALYILLSTGVDVSSLLAWFGFGQAGGAATFALAYAIHKSLAPLRAGLVVMTVPYAKPYWDRVVEYLKREHDFDPFRHEKENDITENKK